MNPIRERLSLFRSEMKKENINWYYMTGSDYHDSEYVSDYFKICEHFSGFTGENVYYIIGLTEAFLWTDGRFFIQAEKELKDTGITLMKMGEENVPTVKEFIRNTVKAGETFAFNGRLISASFGSDLESICKGNGAECVNLIDIPEKIWTDRPAKPTTQIYVLSEEVTGESTESKLNKIRSVMAENGCDYHYLSKLDDIMWILNLRAADIECNPVALSYLIIAKEKAFFFADKNAVNSDVLNYLNSNNIEYREYDTVLDALNASSGNRIISGRVMLDVNSIDVSSYNLINAAAEIVNKKNPSLYLKSVKNETEIKRLKKAYELDSVCVTKFIYWIKNAIKTRTLTEIDAADYIDNLRRNVPGFLDLSFPTISGYGPNGAIVHYSVSEESNATLKPEGMILVDSGGQYDMGTTDVTRTVSLGPVTDNMRLHYTKTAIGMLTLAKAKFLEGCTGRNLDILCRAPLWNMGVDFKHGTGHGVGYILNVHEGPQNLRWKFLEGMEEAVFKPGMITSDEPGVYIENQYGIRIENIILCIKDVLNEFGQFLGFEHLTYAPLDRALIDVSILNDTEIELINEYQAAVYEKMKGHLTKEEEEWLKQETARL